MTLIIEWSLSSISHQPHFPNIQNGSWGGSFQKPHTHGSNRDCNKCKYIFIAWERPSWLFWYFAKLISITLVGPHDCYAEGSWHVRTIFLCKRRRYSQVIHPSRSHHWNHQFNTKWLLHHNCIPREIHWNRIICWYWCLNQKQDLFLDPIFLQWLTSSYCAQNWQKKQKRISLDPSISLQFWRHG